jgi:glycosyltransferase involved in cell wall biosynthesis
MNELIINYAFLSQRVTGQQRYAHEISRRLELRPGVTIARPSGRLSNNRFSSWAWAQRPRLSTKPNQYLLSLTSRSPLSFPRHVVTIHDLFVLQHPEWYSQSYVATHKPILRRQLDRARAFVAVSESTYNELAEYRGTPANIALAPNGVDSGVFGAAAVSDNHRNAVLKKRDITPGHYLLTVGSLDPRKNLARLAQAYGRLSARTRQELPLVVVGGDSGVFRREQVTWPVGTILTGYVDDAELGILYRNARAAVLPSLAEGFGLPVVEAMSNEVPVLMSDIPVFRWVYGSGATYFDPRDVESLHDALENAACHRGLGTAEELAAKAREVRERFSWDHSADSVYELVQSLEG